MMACGGLVSVIGGACMLMLKNYSMARTAAIVAIIPCLSPCIFLGMPFGIWAVVLLSRPDVRARFR